jgi:asparagine synthase (glutamine-hydrolysing)
MHPNVEHVLVRGAQSPLDDLDRYFFLFERPVTNICNGAWLNAINDAARARGLSVMLTGFLGNMTISYNGIQLLPQYLARGRWLKWGREIAALVRNRRMSWLGALAYSFGPHLSRDVWKGLNRMFRKEASDVTIYSAINPRRLKELNLDALAFERDLDLSYRPRKDDFETRLWALRRVDMGNFQKGTLAGWGIDQRDPTIDRRLVEFCLNVPADQFLSKGVTRALARRSFVDRVPKAVLDERRRGLQSADWHERLTAAHGQVLEEINRLNSFAPAARMLNLGRLNTLVHNWPKGGWERESVTVPYRLALLRAISTGHFLRKASGSNQ